MLSAISARRRRRTVRGIGSTPPLYALRALLQPMGHDPPRRGGSEGKLRGRASPSQIEPVQARAVEHRDYAVEDKANDGRRSLITTIRSRSPRTSASSRVLEQPRNAAGCSPHPRQEGRPACRSRYTRIVPQKRATVSASATFVSKTSLTAMCSSTACARPSTASPPPKLIAGVCE
jgi:hypothetical protein